ncbi:MAG: ABC transporter permease [Lewinella sp.]|nr:ABC transporter permease [Lewinella sp.]
MTFSNLKPALRHFQRNKLHAAINILGLALGMAACLVIYLITSYELSFDTFRDGRDRIFRTYSQFSGTFDGTNRGVPAALGPWAADHLAGVEAVAPFHTMSAKISVVQPDGSLKEFDNQPDIARVSPAYFQVFSDYQWLSGSPESSLTEPYSVVLTDEKAGKYFNLDHPEEAVGRRLLYGDSLYVTVTGIIEKEKRQTDLYFSDFISFSTINAYRKFKRNIRLDDWSSTNSSSQVFLKLQPGVSPDKIQDGLKEAEALYKKAGDQWGFVAAYIMQPLRELHFNGKLGIFDQTNWSAASKPTMNLLILIAVLLLLIAAVNFINLETAQSTLRAREIGVRKVLGGTRGGLVRQFLGETLMLTVIAIALSVMLTKWALGFFDEFIPEGVSFEPLSPGSLAFLGGITLVVTLLAGAYPAFVLSGFRPVQALRDKIIVSMRGSGSLNLRRALVVFQFVVAQVLILGTLTVGRQISYLLNADMGFDRNAVIYFSTPWQDTTGRKHVLYQELKRIPEVLAVSLNDGPPASTSYSSNIIRYNNGQEEISTNVYQKFGDTAFIDLYDFQLLAGRNVQNSDTLKELVINETYAHELGFSNPEDVVGKMVKYSSKMVPIVGVVRDFHIFSLRDAIAPTAIACTNRDFTDFGLKLQTKGNSPGDFTSIISKITDKWKSLYPDTEFNYEFLDETIAKFYEAEQRTSKLSRTATLMAILLSCLGLLGLVSFSAVQRTKEIGIRKVLGASVASIVALLSREFITLIGVAFVLAAPLAWIFARKWLSRFAYHFELDWTVFVLTGLLAVLIAFLTMSLQSIRAARANPAESLKSE